MNPAVLIPYRGADERRRRNMRVVSRFWALTGWPVYVADSDGDMFSRAHAVNKAAAQATDADVLVISDVDILPTTTSQIEWACEQALGVYGYVVTFNPLLVLSEAGAQALDDGLTVPETEIIERPRGLWIAQCAIPRALFDECGGMDERFHGYGGEDIGFLMAVWTLGRGQGRIEQPAYHLAHDEMDKSHPHATKNRELAKRYRAAHGNKTAMRALIGER